MKKFHVSLMATCVAMSGFTAQAEAPNWDHPGHWQLFEQANQFHPVEQTRPIVADFTNDNRFDVYYGGGGAWDDMFNVPGCWPWPFLSLMYVQTEEGNFNCFSTFPEYKETRQEERVTDVPAVDEQGNPIYDEEGNPVFVTEIVDVDYYQQRDPESGIIPGMRHNYACFDYDNDGLLDLYMVIVVDSNDYGKEYRGQLPFIQQGGNNCYFGAFLYHNNGNGTFTMIDNHGLPILRPDSNADYGQRLYNHVFAVGDYDRDGYVDIAICGKGVNKVSGEPYRVSKLFHNMEGTGQFEEVFIAETKGGAYGESVNGDPEFEIPGGFLPISGNVRFADLNNDGWLDLLWVGYGKVCYDPKWQALGVNNLSRIYLNQEDGNGGRKFVDVTEADEFICSRSGAFEVYPNVETGYLDIIAGGYVDNLGWILRGYTNMSAEAEQVYGEGYDLNFGSGFDPAWKEDYRPLLRDFNADGIIDIYLDRCDNNNIYYGNLGGTYEKECDYLNIRDFGEASGACPTDFNGDGNTDLFVTGWAFQEGKEYQYIRNVDGGGGHGASAVMYKNQWEEKPEDIDAPTNVHAVIEDGLLTVTWDDNGDYTCAYNVYIETPDRGVVSLVAADPVTGFVRNTTDRHVAIRPEVGTYSIPATAEKGYKVGVQAISLINEKYSAFVWSEEDLGSVGSILAESTNVEVSVEGDIVVVNADATAEVKIVDMMGRTVATGMTNTAINVANNGVMLAVVNGKVVKFVK